MVNLARLIMMKRIVALGDEVRVLRGLSPVPDDAKEMFEDMLVEANNATLVALLEYAVIDAYNHKQGNFTLNKQEG